MTSAEPNPMKKELSSLLASLFFSGFMIRYPLFIALLSVSPSVVPPQILRHAKANFLHSVIKAPFLTILLSSS